jgi:hypothetical protein
VNLQTPLKYFCLPKSVTGNLENHPIEMLSKQLSDTPSSLPNSYKNKLQYLALSSTGAIQISPKINKHGSWMQVSL